MTVNLSGRFPPSAAGPGEYLQLLDFDVNDSLIALLDYKKIHFFSLEGVYENSVSIPCTGMNIKLLSDGNIAVRTSNESYSIYIVNREGKEISKHLETTHSSKLGRFNPFIAMEIRFSYKRERTLTVIGGMKTEKPAKSIYWIIRMF